MIELWRLPLRSCVGVGFVSLEADQKQATAKGLKSTLDGVPVESQP